MSGINTNRPLITSQLNVDSRSQSSGGSSITQSKSIWGPETFAFVGSSFVGGCDYLLFFCLWTTTAVEWEI